VNLNYQGKWVENSRVLTLYGKKNYVGNVCYMSSWTFVWKREE